MKWVWYYIIETLKSRYKQTVVYEVPITGLTITNVDDITLHLVAGVGLMQV